MYGKLLALVSALWLVSDPAAVAARAAGGDDQQEHVQGGARPEVASQTGGQSYGDRNRGGPYGFYSYPQHRHIDGSASQLPWSIAGGGTSLPDNTHGSAYYGLNYGAPYFGGGYYDGGTYYRERRDR
jgi:hypothetical protein